ncbi:MAG: tetratricopeptide repeat protein [Candidatus Thermoplasmatota archaeon]|nr:tetratricopeptide repeat protein [Candidatus Thermoplasmatota archaeon]
MGREDEMRQLEAHLEEALAGKGRTVFISGEAGIGKTRLLEELRSVADAKGFLFLWGNSLHESLTPYMPIYEALKSGGLEHVFAEDVPRIEAVYLVTHTGLLIKDDIREETELNPDIFASMLATVGDFVKESMSKFLGEEKEGALNTLGYEDYRILIESGRSTNLVVVLTGKENEFLIDDMREIQRKAEKEYGVLRDWDGDEEGVQGIGRILRPLIASGKYDGVYYGEDDPKARRNLLFESVSMGLARQSGMKPIVMCVEDLQWADPSTLALMHYVTRNSREKRLLMLGSYRTEDVSSEHPLVEIKHQLDREDLYEEMVIQRLPEEAVSGFLDLLGEVDLDEEFVSRMYSETEGNPLFIIQLLKYLVEDGIVEPEEGIWRLSKPLDEVTIPSKVYNLVVRRLDRVEKEDRKVLDYACVNGELFTSAVLTAALNARKSDVLERLRDLERTHRLINSRNGSFKFDHAKIKEVLYNEIPEELRREYHEIIADSIEALNRDEPESVIGDLAFHYYNSRNGGKALDYLTRAAEKAKKDYSNEEAIRFYFEALEFEDDKKKRREMLVALGDIYKLIGEYDKGMESYEKALECAREDGTKAEIKTKIGGILCRAGEYDDSIRISSEARELVRDTECKEEADSLNIIGTLHWYGGEYDRALEFCGKSLRIKEKIGNQEGIAASLSNIGSVHGLRGEYDRALEFLEKSLRIQEKIGNQQGIAMSLGNIGNVHSERGEYDSALESHEKSLGIFEKIGNQRGFAFSLTNIGIVHYYRGEYDSALEWHEKSLGIFERIGESRHIAACLISMGQVHFRRGEYDSALEFHSRGLEIARRTGAKEQIIWACLGTSRADTDRNALKEALEFCKRAYSLSTELGAEGAIAESRCVFGTIYSEQKMWKESIENFERSIEILERIGQKRALAESYHEFGLMWKKKGDNEEARANLNRALETYTRLNLDFWAGKVNAALESLSE